MASPSKPTLPVYSSQTESAAKPVKTMQQDIARKRKEMFQKMAAQSQLASTAEMPTAKYAASCGKPAAHQARLCGWEREGSTEISPAPSRHGSESPEKSSPHHSNNDQVTPADSPAQRADSKTRECQVAGQLRGRQHPKNNAYYTDQQSKTSTQLQARAQCAHQKKLPGPAKLLTALGQERARQAARSSGLPYKSGAPN